MPEFFFFLLCTSRKESETLYYTFTVYPPLCHPSEHAAKSFLSSRGRPNNPICPGVKMIPIAAATGNAVWRRGIPLRLRTICSLLHASTLLATSPSGLPLMNPAAYLIFSPFITRLKQQATETPRQMALQPRHH